MTFRISTIVVVGLLLAAFRPCSVPAQTVAFPESWLFKTGDDLEYRPVECNDSDWQSIRVPAQWENAGFPGYDGFAWYRLHFNVPRALLNRDLTLCAGTIDDADETYLNGTLIGSTGRFPPAAASAWNEQRAYRVPAHLLREKNVLAVRVYDMRLGGGIAGGVIGLFDKAGVDRVMNLTPGPKKSFSHLVTSNGMIAAVLDARTGTMETVLPRIFQAHDSGNVVTPFISGLRLNSSEKPASVRYARNTHVIEVRYRRITVSWFAPFTTGERVLYAMVSGEKGFVDTTSFSIASGSADVRTAEVEFSGKSGTARKYLLFSVRDTSSIGGGDLRASLARLRTSGGRLLEDEIQFMRVTIGRCRTPKALTPREKNLFEQSITVLKMAQVAQYEPFPRSRGQILASLPPGIWNISWVRDASYSIMALSRLGLFEEARQGLEFMLAAEAGRYSRYIHTDGRDYGVGTEYQMSVCRYFGNGKEETDFNSDGPNIELDGFGLFLTAFSDYVRRSGDAELLMQRASLVAAKVADPIVLSIRENLLIRQDSGPWERHLPGKQYAYTSIACAKGLRDFGELSRESSIPGSAKYIAASNRLTDGIRQHLVVGGKYLKGNAGGTKSDEFEYYDAATFEAFGFGLLKDPALFASHRSVYEKSLCNVREGRGFCRVNGGDTYDRSEWVFLDLRIASAMVRFGEKARARKLLDWVTAQSSLNFNLIAELYGEKTAAYEGAVPMVGFGAGAFILSLMDYHE
jgi:GH15 family glucan-1,4-alpha-glucosidase